MTRATSLGLYVHVPFCASTCDFCAFYQEKPRRGDIERYLKGIEREIVLRDLPQAVETVFFGGGTPGLLHARDLDSLCQLVHRVCPKSGPEEWTVEIAPSAVKADKLAVLKGMGVTRISMGAQTFDSGLLDALGRQHSRKQILQAWQWIRETDFPSTNIDLIFAIPGQTIPQLQADLDAAVALQPDHISTYCLTFEEDTALYVKLSDGKVSRDPDYEADLYRFAWEYLERAGYVQYEVSNFARPGHACRHNLNTWSMQDWVGLGPSAASQYGGRRYANPANLDEWLDGVDAGFLKRVDVMPLTESLRALDALVFGLRMNTGVALGPILERLPAQHAAILKRLHDWERIGLACVDGGIARLTLEGRLLADRLGADLLELAPAQDLA